MSTNFYTLSLQKTHNLKIFLEHSLNGYEKFSLELVELKSTFISVIDIKIKSPP